MKTDLVELNHRQSRNVAQRQSTPSHEVVLLEEEITYTVGETEHVDVTTVMRLGCDIGWSDGCTGL